MPSSKSKRTQRKRRRRHNPFAKLKRKLREGPWRDMEVVFGPGGDVKMSDVLFAFIEPYRQYADTDQSLPTGTR
jgi:hypothetical protein